MGTDHSITMSGKKGSNMKRADRFNKGESGFTLIEILIAMTIFAIGILAVTSMQIMALQTNARASRSTEAFTLATDKMEELIRTDYDDIDSATNPEVVDKDEYDHLDTTYTWDWNVTEDNNSEFKTITVTVSWRYLNDRQISLTRIRGAKYDQD